MADGSETDGADRKRGGGARLVYDTLRDEILDLVLKPGEPVDEVVIGENARGRRTARSVLQG